ncbi:hypothetical protein [Phenylobacterium sp.]|jgi:hypothetical protein|uniref:hypothetical protein n=1 Tax=Phenylobacterium sp. TaxID=1871053 RepID=UPI002F3F264F
MRNGVSVAVLAFVLGLAGAARAADAPSATGPAKAKAYSPPRTPSGHPDLTGVWSNASVTNLTRAPGVAKLVVGKDEAAKLAKDSPFEKLAAAEEGPSNFNDNLLKDGNNDRGYNTFWIDPGKSLANVKGEFRTSWIVEPANGQLPLSDEGRKLLAQYRKDRADHLFYGPEYLPVSERCLIGFTGAGGPGMLNTIYNNNYQIVETPDAIVIDVEMVHDARVIPLFKDKATALAHHRPQAIDPWLGDSVGWWEGDTLVVETIHVNPEEGRTGPIYLSDKGRVTERFTRTSPTQIFYRFEVDDPVYYTSHWAAEESLNARREHVYEYACHEGNYAMTGILGGARKQEAQGIKPTMGPGIFGTPIPEKTKGGE